MCGIQGGIIVVTLGMCLGVISVIGVTFGMCIGVIGVTFGMYICGGGIFGIIWGITRLLKVTWDTYGLGNMEA